MASLCPNRLPVVWVREKQQLGRHQHEARKILQFNLDFSGRVSTIAFVKNLRSHWSTWWYQNKLFCHLLLLVEDIRQGVRGHSSVTPPISDSPSLLLASITCSCIDTANSSFVALTDPFVSVELARTSDLIVVHGCWPRRTDSIVSVDRRKQ